MVPQGIVNQGRRRFHCVRAHARQTEVATVTADDRRTGGAAQDRLATDAYELDAFKPTLSQAEAQRRIAMLSAKLPLLDAPPHTL